MPVAPRDSQSVLAAISPSTALSSYPRRQFSDWRTCGSYDAVFGYLLRDRQDG